MTSTVKCTKCNIVIDEMLSYIQNKISVMGEESLVRLCTTSFTSDEIQTSKTLLFESLPNTRRNVQRKGDGKAQREINDIIQLFKTTDPDQIPIFVARNLEKLPPLTFDHLDCTKLLKDLVRLQTDLETVKETYATSKDLEELRNDMQKISSVGPPARLSMMSSCNVNNRRGAWCMNSGPHGLTNAHDSTRRDSDGSVKYDTLSPIRTNDEMQCKSVVNEGKNSNCTAQSDDNMRLVTSTANEMSHRNEQLTDQPVGPAPAGIEALMDEKLKLNSEHNQNAILHSGEEEWKEVKYKKDKRKYRYRGQFGIANELNQKFKAAERNIPMFISNIHKDTREEDIIEHIMAKTQVCVSLERIDIKKETNHKAYKFFVCPGKLPLFLDKSIWPKGIIFRKFVHFKYRYSIGENSEHGNKNTKPPLA
ncbi:uncharacterized protein LOC134662738 [Cydia amplana]|uniref:uncharacterized protein LOC134662738 n=1 Tax=Cydia amplana TaxID=1869771 RepID=UPI002FE5E2D7